MTRYAEGTKVSSDQTRREIEKLVQSHGATSFAAGWEDGGAHIAFAIHDRRLRFHLTMPDPKEKRFTHTESGTWMRSEPSRKRMWEQACRARWRALLLVIKAKLEAVQCGISTVEDEFMAQTVLPSGRTVGEELRAPIARALTSNGPLLLSNGEGR